MKYFSVVLTFLLAFFLSGCFFSEEAESERARLQNAIGEYIYRRHNEYLFKPEPATQSAPILYSWENNSFHSITKEYFRCKGSSLNPPHVVQRKQETLRFFDCGGAERHSLPLHNDKEFVYPILINLLNYLQHKSGKKIVITSGHRCPQHNIYVDDSIENQSSKHMIGAEVSFYVQGWEDKPAEIIKLIHHYYSETPKYKGLKDFQEFSRYEKQDTNVSTLPWMNKEVFVKLFKKKEGRNFDNRHPYPYISIQVRYDMETQTKVFYSWEKAHRNFLRQ
ncbi:hypothetical protein DB41_KK00120 [Neochlamydia sp. TUME1]|uniref:D-Ala-D-Ala carboxypeptidase family metallohydrolase n=1 Tax=Neochlamydia sp. TUME1 TaxID=1478174 RepID=UPI00057CC216|nr:D-Ala-D-Ala carboxypeptidase family metallohydrolase [Neochlamydia sp. TUME1]KIC72486.1 hypothetical protein DB41_KK00120 [Neochlamydia sp. TUME1]